MTSGGDPSAFAKLMPGFDFMRQFATADATKNIVPNLASWVTPTVSIEDIDKRITDLKAVLFWLEQNAHVLRATVQALEVQKMTLTALRNMNLNLADVAKAFTTPVQTAEPAAPETGAAEQDPAEPKAAPVDPLQWWGALTQQFQNIAATLGDAVQAAPPPASADSAGKPARKSAAKRAAKPAAPKKSAARGGNA